MTGCRVLVVDDESHVRDVLSRGLERDGYTVFLAAAADDACELLAAYSIDAIVVDLDMPAMSGQTLFHIILTQWPEYKDRIAVMTGELRSAARDRWIEHYRLPVIQKPIKLAEVRAAVDAITAEERREVNGP